MFAPIIWRLRANVERAARTELYVVGEAADSEVGVAGLDAVGQKNEIDLRGPGQVRDSRLIHPRLFDRQVDNSAVIVKSGKLRHRLDISCGGKLGARQRRTASGSQRHDDRKIKSKKKKHRRPIRGSIVPAHHRPEYSRP